MARGSSAGSGAASKFNSVEMLQSGGQVDNSGRYTITRKYYVTDQNDLLTTPELGGMRATALSYQKIAGGIWEKTIEFAAAVGSSQTGVVSKLSQDGKDEGRLLLETTMQQLPIEEHPERDDLIKKYNGSVQNGKIIFSATYSGQGTGTSGGTEKPNPMFGVRYFSAPAATLRHIYTATVIPSNLFGRVFKIIETNNLPGDLPDLPDYANKAQVNLKYYWQIQMPQVSISGDLIEITDIYTLTKPMTAEAAADLNRIANN
jgi:hypothetical protein